MPVAGSNSSARTLSGHAPPGVQMLSEPTTRTRPSFRTTARVLSRAVKSMPAATQVAFAAGVEDGCGESVGRGDSLAVAVGGGGVGPAGPPLGEGVGETPQAATASATRTLPSARRTLMGSMGISLPDLAGEAAISGCDVPEMRRADDRIVAAMPFRSRPLSSQPLSSQPVSSQPVSSQPVSSQPVSQGVTRRAVEEHSPSRDSDETGWWRALAGTLPRHAEWRRRAGAAAGRAGEASGEASGEAPSEPPQGGPTLVGRPVAS